MEELAWLSQSQNLNFIEHLWVELEHQLTNLTSYIAEWKHIPKDTIQNPVESLPRRMWAVMATKREQLDYFP